MGYPPPHVIYIHKGSNLTAFPAPTKTGLPGAEGLYRVPADGNWTWTFQGWQHEGKVWYAANPIMEDMTINASWASQHGPLAIPVLEPIIESPNLIHRAFYYANANPGNYVLVVGSDVYVPTSFDTGRDVFRAGAILKNSTVKLLGTDTMQTITRSSPYGMLLYVTNEARLILGNNITLAGNPEGPATLALLVIDGEDASLEMLAGSRITGHRQTTILTGVNLPNEHPFNSTVTITNGAAFDMRGGEITGNMMDPPAGAASVGGVMVAHQARFDMHGGEISYNRSVGVVSAGGVRIIDGAVFNLRGGDIHGNDTGEFLANASAGGVIVSRFATFNMYGGRIFNNTNFTDFHMGGAGGVSTFNGKAQIHGGQIFNNRAIGTFAAGGIFRSGGEPGTPWRNTFIHGGEIFGNVAYGTYVAGGINVEQNSYLNITGGAIFANRTNFNNSAGGIRLHLASAILRISGGTIYGIDAVAGRSNIVDHGQGQVAAALRVAAGAANAQYGTWTYTYTVQDEQPVRTWSFTQNGIIVAGGAAGIVNDTIRVIDGTLQD